MSSFRLFMSKNGGTASLVFVLTLSLALNVYFAREARFGRTRFPVPSKMRVGTKLPSALPLLDVNGKTTQLIFDDSRPTVLYVFSPTCGWCKRNEANIKTLVNADSHFRFIGLSITPTGLKDYIAQRHAPFPVYAVQSKEQSAKLGLSVTPETIVVGPGAVIEEAWKGAYTGDNQKQIEQFFNAKLPGLEDAAAVVAH